MDYQRVSHWVLNGVYFGYREDDIISFVQRISKGIYAPPNTILSGTGYVSLATSISKQDLIDEINQRRFCSSPFPDCVDPDKAEEEIALLLQSSEDFREVVFTLLKKIGVISNGIEAGNLQPPGS